MTGFVSPEVNRVVRVFKKKKKKQQLYSLESPFTKGRRENFLSTVRKLPLTNVTPIIDVIK